jgi:hypothetical protein
MSNGQTGLSIYWSYSVCCLQKEADTVIPTTVFLLLAHRRHTEAIICHWWCMETKWVKDPIYGNQQYVKWLNRSILIIIHVLYSKSGWYCDSCHLFLVPCPSWHWGHQYLSLVIYGVNESEEAHVWIPAVCQLKQLVYHIDHDPVYYFLSSSVSTAQLDRGHHLSLVRNWMKVTGEAHACMGTSSVSNGVAGLYW